jgi:hypothetical protein
LTVKYSRHFPSAANAFENGAPENRPGVLSSFFFLSLHKRPRRPPEKDKDKEERERERGKNAGK